MHTKQNLAALTGIRGVAALWVVVFHLHDELRGLFPDAYSLLKPVIKSGFLGVDLFFVLSGFIIAHNYYRDVEENGRSSLWPFLVKRFARIYPAYLAGFFLAVAVVGVLRFAGYELSTKNSYSMFDALLTVTVLKAWTFSIQRSWNVIDWSVSAEWFAYMAFPAYVAVTKVLDRGKIVLLMSGLLFLGAWIAGLELIGRTSAMEIGLFRVVTCFGVGVGAYLIRMRTSFLPAWSHWVAIALLLCVPRLYAASTASGVDALGWTPAVFALAIYWLSAPQSRSILAHRVALYGGRVSYSLYLVHGLVLLSLRAIWPWTDLEDAALLARLGFFVFNLGVMFVLADLLHRLVEQPARALVVRTFLPTGRA